MRGRPHAPRTLRALVDPGRGCRRTLPGASGAGVRPHVRHGGPGLGTARAVAGLAANGPLFGVPRARLRQRGGLPPVFPLVPGHGPAGAQLQCQRLHLEPVAAAGARRGMHPVRRGSVGDRCGEFAVGRTLPCGRNPDRGRGMARGDPVGDSGDP